METLLMLSHAASEFRKEGNCINLFGNKLGIVQGTQVLRFPFAWTIFIIRHPAKDCNPMEDHRRVAARRQLIKRPQCVDRPGQSNNKVLLLV